MNDKREIQSADSSHNHFYGEPSQGAVYDFVRRKKVKLNIAGNQGIDVVASAERNNLGVEFSFFEISLCVRNIKGRIHRAANGFADHDDLTFRMRGDRNWNEKKSRYDGDTRKSIHEKYL